MVLLRRLRLPLPPSVSVGCPVLSILLAIELGARVLVSWEHRDSQSRVQPLECARKRRQGCYRRLVARFGSGCVGCQERTKIGDHCRWPPVVWRRAACCGCSPRVTTCTSTRIMQPGDTQAIIVIKVSLVRQAARRTMNFGRCFVHSFAVSFAAPTRDFHHMCQTAGP